MIGKPVLFGDVGFLNLGDILQLLGSNGSTGNLRISSKYSPYPGLVYIVSGNPIHASVGPTTGVEALNSLFGWLDAEFEFWETPVDCKRTIQKGRMNLILDGLSLLDEGEIERLGPVCFAQDKENDSGRSSSLPTVKGPLVDYIYVVDEESFRDGQTIAVEGKYGNWIWVVLEGTVRITKNTPSGILEILRAGDGAFVGSTASFGMSGNVRSANVIAEGDVQLGVLDARRLVEDYHRLSDTYRGVVNSLDRRLRMTTDSAVNVYLNRNSMEVFKGYKTVIEQGAEEDRLLRISQGSATVVRKIENGSLVPLGVLSSGDFFGYIPFLDMGQEPEAASIVGSEDLKVKSLDTNALREEHLRMPATLKNFLEYTATCISITTRVACSFFKKTHDKTSTKNKTA